GVAGILLVQRGFSERGGVDGAIRDQLQCVGQLGRLRLLPAGPTGPGSRAAVRRPGAHQPGYPAGAVRRPGSAAWTSLPRRPTRRVSRPPAEHSGPVRARPYPRRPPWIGTGTAIPGHLAGLYRWAAE